MSKEVIGYYADWQYYDRGQLISPAKCPDSVFQKYTILNYAFFDYLESAKDGSLRGIDDNSSCQVLYGPFNWNPQPEDVEKKYLAQAGGWKTGYFQGGGIIDKMHENGGKVVASIGGWSFSPGMPQLFDTEANRQRFADNCAEVINELGIDGIDIDWEYPGKSWSDPSIEAPKHGTSHTPTPRDKENFVDLMKKLRTALDAIRPGLILTSCFNANPEACAYDIPELMKYLTYFNLMTYDLAGAFSAKTGHHTNLFDATWDDDTVYSCDKAVKAYKALGVPADKINIGLASYGRTMSGATTMNAPFAGAGDTTFVSGQHMPMYYDIKANQASWTKHWDDVAKAVWFDNGNGVLTCDDEQSAEEKGAYIVREGLAGIIEWETSGGIMSDYSMPLHDALYAGFESNTVYQQVTVAQPANGTIVPGTKQVAQGSSVTFTVTADAGYICDNITVNGNTTAGNSVTVVATGDITASASLSADATPYYTVTTTGSNVSFSPTNPSVREGDNVVILATAVSGTSITDVKVDGISQGTDNAITLNNVTTDHTVTVEVEASANAWVAQVYATGGTIVTHNGATYKNKWWAGAYDVPGVADVWELIEGEVVDTTAPVITLVDGTVTLTEGDTFSEPGFSASDNVDGDVTGLVVVAGDTINTAVVGTYVITYTVEDAAGNSITVSRNVVVEADLGDIVAPIITLNGGAITLELGEAFVEPGFSASDDEDGDITASVIVTDNINPSVVGSYNVTYSVTDANGNVTTVVRPISVVDTSVADTTAPVINLAGGTGVITIEVGGNYVEPGYTATDNVDGNITTSVVVTSDVDTSVAGSYTVTYTVEDAAGNETVTTRTVTVETGSTGSTCDGVSVWDAAANWTSYTLGDKRVDGGKLYECISLGHSYYAPSGPYGHYGWSELATC